MKVKDIERTANVAWSPKNHHPIYLAAGTAASQLDASFSTNAALELYALNITEPGPATQLIYSISSEHRFHKLIWGSAGSDSAGTIIGGCDDGLLQIYSASKLLKNEEALVGKQQKHSGPVHALDFNSFQRNLFATGAGESEIFIWDLNNTSSPMSPGAKSQPSEDVLSVSWNRQVQHILASSFASKCVIWDLRKNEPIIKLTDTVSRIRWKMVTWHPEVATQLCLASEEDHSPVLQLWDLRFATSPLKTLENHQRGVLAISWCIDDSDLLVSCGKDDRILCWNPNSNHPNGEVLSEIARTNQWSFDVVWCPRNPALIACPNYDGHVSVYSIMGGKTQQIQTTNKIADSFPGMDGFVQTPAPAQSQATVSVDLSKPPKWLKKPVGASFGFGGKLITFEHDKEALAQAQQNVQPGQGPLHVSRTVQISQVITEPEFVQKSAQLEQSLESGNFIEYCLNKADSTNDQHKKYIWHFLKANFEQNPRAELLNLLGYRIEDINNKLSQHIGKPLLQNNVNELSDLVASNRIEDYDQTYPTPFQDPFSGISQENNSKRPVTPFKIKTKDGFLPNSPRATLVANQNINYSNGTGEEQGHTTLTDLSFDNLNNSLNNNEIISFLQEWGMPNLFDRITKAGIYTLNAFRYMTERDLDMLFSSNELELKIMFRKHLTEWRVLNDIGYPNSLDAPDNNIFLKKIYDFMNHHSSSSSSDQSLDDRDAPSPSDFDLRAYLSKDGQKIKKAMEDNNGRLSVFCRDTLIQEIVRHYINADKFMHESEFVKISNDICEIFPLESKSSYYYKDAKNVPGGKLYWAYKNMAAKLRKGNLFPREKKRKIGNSTSNLSKPEYTPAVPSENKIWLKFHTEPWVVVEEKWRSTISERKAEFANWDKKNITYYYYLLIV